MIINSVNFVMNSNLYFHLFVHLLDLSVYIYIRWNCCSLYHAVEKQVSVYVI